MIECPTTEHRRVGSDPAALDALRRDVLEAVGAEYGTGILYAVGYTEGLLAALRQMHTLGAVAPGTRCTPEAGPPLLFTLTGGTLPGHFWGRLQDSVEAHRTTRAAETGCLVSAGYASGWYSELLGEPILVRERQCRARGAPCCRFEARPLDAWTAAGDPFVEALLPYLDFAALRKRANAALTASSPGLSAGEPGEEQDGFMFGPFDPMSPAVHIWGPLIIMPYAGGADAEQSIDTVLCDSEADEIRSAVVDLTGARIESLELPGLMQLVQRLQSLEIECILVGLSADQTQALRAGGTPFAETLFEGDLSRAIALGFQLAQHGSDA